MGSTERVRNGRGSTIIEPQSEDHKVLELHNLYLRYRLPLMIEVPCYEWAEGVDGQSLPRR